MIDYRKMMHLYERGVSKNCLAVSFKCKWETVDRAVERIASKWGVRKTSLRNLRTK